MLRAFTERHDSGAEGSNTQEKSKTWGASSFKQNVTSKPKSNHKRKGSAKPKVLFKPQMSTSQAAKKSKTTVTKWTSHIDTNTMPVTKRHKAFASLFVSLLATSPIAIEIDAADEHTFESANKASTTLLPKPPPKAHVQPAGAARPSEIRKTRWKRFKYEMGLKMQSGRKGKGRREAAQVEETELADMGAQEREGRQQSEKVGIA